MDPTQAPPHMTPSLGACAKNIANQKSRGLQGHQKKYAKIQKAAWGGYASVRPLVLGGEVVELEEVGWPPSCGIGAFSIACLSAEA